MATKTRQWTKAERRERVIRSIYGQLDDMQRHVRSGKAGPLAQRAIGDKEEMLCQAMKGGIYRVEFRKGGITLHSAKVVTSLGAIDRAVHRGSRLGCDEVIVYRREPDGHESEYAVFERDETGNLRPIQ